MAVRYALRGATVLNARPISSWCQARYHARPALSTATPATQMEAA